jgi:hypothetical protein
MIGTLARLAAIGTAGAAYVLGVRPQLQRWGATEAEVAEAVPGDGLVPAPRFSSTRAISIAAPPSSVWPWLVQIGEGRGGLYSYDALERLVGLGMESADVIVGELQDLAPGDTIRLAPIGGPDGLAMIVDRLEAPSLLVLRSARPGTGADDGDGSETLGAGDYFTGLPAVSWTLVLRDLDEGATTLSRWRMTGPLRGRDLFTFCRAAPLRLEKMMLHP